MRILPPTPDDVAWIHARRNDLHDAADLDLVQQRVREAAFCYVAYDNTPVALFGGSEPRLLFMHLWGLFTPAASACGFSLVRAMLRAFYVTVPKEWPVRVYYTLQREGYCNGVKLLETLGFERWRELDQFAKGAFWNGYKIWL